MIKNKNTKYIGTISIQAIILFFLSLLYILIELNIDITITNASILYPHTFIVLSTKPAPYKEYEEESLFNVINLLFPIFCASKNTIPASNTDKIMIVFDISFINLLPLSIFLSTPSKNTLNDII